jgi:putative two-component system response regulator
VIPGAEGPEPGAVLVVDDHPEIRSTLQRFLERLGHRVDTAASVPEALERLSVGAYDVVITDLQMPGPSGLDLLSEVRARAPGTRTILMSGRAQAADAAVAIERGIDRLLLKPFDLQDLRAGVEKALAEKRAQEKVARDRETFEALVRQRENESKLWILRAARALASAVEAKDAYTRGHTARVTAYALAIAERIGGIDVSSFRLAGDLHDVGKIGVPDAVLNKPERLTEEEFALVRKHPETGARILEPLIDDPLVIGVVRWHHERWDGSGYPDGLAGERIPLPARVLAVADTLDAMTSSRAYRTGLPWEVAVAEIERCAGSQFDPRVVRAFGDILPRLEALRESFPAKEIPAEGSA